MLPPKLILSPIDFSDPSHEALNTAADLASEIRVGAAVGSRGADAAEVAFACGDF